MNVFINDIHVRFIKKGKKLLQDSFGVTFSNIRHIDIEVLKGSVLIKDMSIEDLQFLLQFFKENKLKKLKSVTIISNNKKALVAYFKSQYTIILAAGGIVEKKQKILIIYRLNRWDFPKGKLEKNESPRESALREVEEECNIKVRLGKKVCTTWHTYTHKRKAVLKKTYWYAMKCLDDKNMKAQIEEGIEEVRWATIEKAEKLTNKSYRSIQFLFKKYIEKQYRCKKV